MTLSIDTMYAFLAVDDEGEGVMAFKSPAGWVPMVGADEKRVDQYREIAQDLASASGKRCVLVRFSNREDLEVIEPGTPDPDKTIIVTNDPMAGT